MNNITTNKIYTQHTAIQYTQLKYLDLGSSVDKNLYEQCSEVIDEYTQNIDHCNFTLLTQTLSSLVKIQDTVSCKFKLKFLEQIASKIQDKYILYKNFNILSLNSAEERHIHRQIKRSTYQLLSIILLSIRKNIQHLSDNMQPTVVLEQFAFTQYIRSLKSFASKNHKNSKIKIIKALIKKSKQCRSIVIDVDISSFNILSYKLIEQLLKYNAKLDSSNLSKLLELLRISKSINFQFFKDIKYDTKVHQILGVKYLAYLDILFQNAKHNVSNLLSNQSLQVINPIDQLALLIDDLKQTRTHLFYLVIDHSVAEDISLLESLAQVLMEHKTKLYNQQRSIQKIELKKLEPTVLQKNSDQQLLCSIL